MKIKYFFCPVLIIIFLITSCERANNNSGLSSDNSKKFRNISAAQLVSEIKIGWNLGNTLDATNLAWLPADASVHQYERGWGNPVTTPENFTTLKKAGFNAVRIPVSWGKCTDDIYNIRPEWMKRVTEIVDYAVLNDMYIIVNTHHDEDLFKFTDDETPESLRIFAKIWEQIAFNFNDYSEKLIFEGLNEPRTKGSPAEWSGGTNAERINVNKHNQLFVDTVRASGGNNIKRILMVPTYAASADESAMKGLVIPQDTINSINKIIVSIHAYAPYNFALNQGNGAVSTWSSNSGSDKAGVNGPLDLAYNYFVSKGIPVIMGEYGAVDRNNIDDRTEWAQYYISYAKSKGIPCFWWDNGNFSPNGEVFGFLNRRDNTFPFKKMLDAMMKAAK